METKIGVVVGQFQVPRLEWHPGYNALLKRVADENDQVLILLGEANSISQGNPLPFKHRQAMFAEEYPAFSVERIPDMPDDTKWVRYLDSLVNNNLVRLALQTAVPARACLYGSRESFLATYYQQGGRFTTTLLPSGMSVGNVLMDVSHRIQLEQRSSVDIRTGLIQAWENMTKAA